MQEAECRRYALVPLRSGQRLGQPCGCGARLCDCCVVVLADDGTHQKPPFVVLEHDKLIGKPDFLGAVWSACATRFSHSSGTCSCPDCAGLTAWVKPSIPSRLLRFGRTSCHDHTGDDRKNTTCSVWVRAASYATKNYVRWIRRDGNVEVLLNQSSNPCAGTTKETFMGPWPLQPGDVLRFMVVAEHAQDVSASPLEFRLCRIAFLVENGGRNEGAREAERAVDNVVVGTGAGVVDTFPPRSRYAAALNVLDEAVAKESDDADGDSHSVVSEPLESQAAAVPWQLVDASQDGAATVVPENSHQLLDVALPAERLTASVRMAIAKDDADATTSPRSFPSSSREMDERFTPGCVLHTDAAAVVKSARRGPQRQSVVPFEASSWHERAGLEQASVAPATPPSRTTPPTKRRRTASTTTMAVTDEKISKAPISKAPVESFTSKSAKKFVLFFVEKGTDMHKNTHIKALRKHAELRGAEVLDAFDKAQPPWPTHFVISQKVSSLDGVASALNFQDVPELSEFVALHGIVCATRAWAAPSGSAVDLPFQEPTMLEQIIGIRSRSKSTRGHLKATDLTTPPSSPQKRKGDAVPLIRNKDLAEHFHRLSKSYQECPLFPEDVWKAYSFQVLSGRLRHIDFVVTNDPEILKRLKTVKGFGESSMQVITEYLATGSSNRMRELEMDKLRIAMKVMMNIWGVGRVRASELVHAGYRRIGSVRQAVANGALRLERNQFIGLQCYEDIIEEMTRDEAEQIAAIAFDFIKRRYPSAVLSIMGSYRRGKSSCGDVDILITHPDYADVVPPNALGVIVDELRAAGHIAHHLTFISGMKSELFESLPASAAKHLMSPQDLGRSRDKKDKYSMSSWMGVFNSPVTKGRCRRVDIKFYPYAERVFASLYFTGNGHFNRSMRLLAKRKYNYTLSDHGILNISTGKQVLKNPRSEHDVFNLLGLKWKEPTERDCFDAVESVSDGEAPQSPHELTRAEVIRESSEHTWIN